MLTNGVLASMFLLAAGGLLQGAESRLSAVQRRGVLTCGVEPAVPGFVQVDAAGRYAGLDADVCRALATAILGSPDLTRFVRIAHVNDFRASPDIDVVARRLTWELRRESPLGLLFAPVTFYDGQGFLVPRSLGVATPAGLAGRRVCVASGPVFEVHLDTYFAERALSVDKTVLASPHAYAEIAAALSDGTCQAYSGDLSDLGAIRLALDRPAAFQILDELISKEPLAPLVRDDDVPFFNIVRWTIAALIRAEELGVSSANVERMRSSRDPEVQTLLGVVAGNGRALGLRESWAADAIRLVGNYGEIFERNLGRESALGLDRGLNRLWTDGGLMYAPPLR
jgi:general L-amino acid transport system substrate-binding protein